MIEVKNLCFGYNKRPMCLKDICFSVGSGEAVGLLGGQGMGKTALLRVLAGLEKQYFGEIIIDGKNIRGLSGARPVSYLPSEPVLINKTVRDNIYYLLKIENITLSDQEILKIFELFNFKRGLNEKIKKLSLKEKRLLCLIRSYIKSSTVLLIDDQTALLSDSEAQDIKNAISLLINSKNASKTAILAFETSKAIMDENIRFLYLSYPNIYSFNNFSSLEPIDLFAANYLGLSLKEFILKNEGGEFYLYNYEVIKQKKKEIIEYREKFKFSDKLNEELRKVCTLSSGEGIMVELSFSGELELNNSKIVKNLESGNYHIFDKMLKEKII